MSAITVAETLLSPDEFLAFEEKSDERHEYLNGVVYLTAGGSENHDFIEVDLLTALNRRLGNGDCRAFSGNMKLRIDEHHSGRFYYPDAMVVCGPRTGQPFQVSPTVLFEVLSDSTERVDRGEKRDAYLAIPSLQAYVLIAQHCVKVEVWRRTSEVWQGEVLTEVTDTLEIAAIGCSIPVAEIYARVQW